MTLVMIPPVWLDLRFPSNLPARPWRILGTGAECSQMNDVVLANILFTDVVRSSEKAAELGDRRWHDLLELHHSAVREELKRFGGDELDTAGDGFVASFAALGQAVRCAAAITERVGQIGLSVRAGVHTGECERIEGKLCGIAVNIGSRVCGEAGPSEVFVSSTVRDLLAGSGLVFVDRGLRALKGVAGEWHMYSLAPLPNDGVVPARIQLCGR